MAGLKAVIADLTRSRMPAGMPTQVHRLVAAGVDTPVLGHPRTTDSRDVATAASLGHSQTGMDLFARVNAGVTHPGNCLRPPPDPRPPARKEL